MSLSVARDLPALDALRYEPLLRAALAEDLGTAGDITSNAVVPPGARLNARIVARANGRLAGLDVALRVFSLLDPAIVVRARARDGSDVRADEAVASVAGNARSILAAERTALNLLSRLSGIATLTAAYVRATGGHPARIADTRKTTPGMRALEKYSVRAGGGMNHRFGLFDAVLIKDNHVVAAGGVGTAIRAARANAGHMVKVEVEVDTFAQLREALEAGADAVLLDNMSPAQLREAVAETGGRALLEASGGVSLEDAAAIAATGVDIISIGRLTHSAPALDFGLDAA